MFATAHTTAGEIGGHALKHADTVVLRTGQGVSNGIQEIMEQNAQHLIKKKQVHVQGDAVVSILDFLTEQWVIGMKFSVFQI